MKVTLEAMPGLKAHDYFGGGCMMMKKKFGMLITVCLIFLLALPVSVFAGGPAIPSNGTNLSETFGNRILTVNVSAFDINYQPASNGPVAVRAKLLSGTPGNYVYQTVNLTLTSSNPSQGSYVYTSYPLPYGWTIIEIVVDFGNFVIGKSANYVIS
jgi:hypothetical protein